MHQDEGFHDLLVSLKGRSQSGAEWPSFPNPHRPSSDRMERRVRAYSQNALYGPTQETKSKHILARRSQGSAAWEREKRNGMVKVTWLIEVK